MLFDHTLYLDSKWKVIAVITMDYAMVIYCFLCLFKVILHYYQGWLLIHCAAWKEVFMKVLS